MLSVRRYWIVIQKYILYEVGLIENDDMKIHETN